MNLLLSRVSRSDAETEQTAIDCYRQFMEQKEECLLLLQGQLGAGKTAFVRGLGKALGIRDSIQSPTFNLLNCHPAGQGRHALYHYDLYRLQKSELAELEFLDYWNGLGQQIIHAIEWPERMSDWRSKLDIYYMTIEITQNENRAMKLESRAETALH